MKKFEHEALRLDENKGLVYTAMSKKIFYYRAHISKFVLEKHKVPLNPFMIFDYFLLDSVDRDLVRAGNNNLVKKCDELWVFGPISDGVLAEIKIFKETGKSIKYFDISNLPKEIVEINSQEVEFEDSLKEFAHLL